MRNDRTVHARDGELEIVRYDRAGKWFVEYKPARGRSAYQTNLAGAVGLACSPTAKVFYGKRGGKLFDKRVKQQKLVAPVVNEVGPHGYTDAQLPCSCPLQYGPSATVCDHPCHWTYRFMFTDSPVPQPETQVA
jgi:hypothetical protein